MYVMASQMRARVVGTGQDILRKNGIHARLHGDTGFCAGNYLDNLVKVESPSPVPETKGCVWAAGIPTYSSTRQSSGWPSSGVGTLAAGATRWRRSLPLKDE
jgi:hypothetical protein